MRSRLLALSVLAAACGGEAPAVGVELPEEAYDLNSTPITIRVFRKDDEATRAALTGATALRVLATMTETDAFAPGAEASMPDDVNGPWLEVPVQAPIPPSPGQPLIVSLVGWPSGKLHAKIVAVGSQAAVEACVVSQTIDSVTARKTSVDAELAANPRDCLLPLPE